MGSGGSSLTTRVGMYSWPKLGLQKKGGGGFYFFQVSPQFQFSFNYTYYTLKNKSIIKNI